jgi:hypothetical protein
MTRHRTLQKNMRNPARAHKRSSKRLSAERERLYREAPLPVVRRPVRVIETILRGAGLERTGKGREGRESRG